MPHPPMLCKIGGVEGAGFMHSGWLHAHKHADEDHSHMHLTKVASWIPLLKFLKTKTRGNKVSPPLASSDLLCFFTEH